MSIIDIRNISQRYDDKDLFVKSNLKINAGEHIGVVGLNGAGKSTFINILAGKVLQDEGEIIKIPNLRMRYLDQHATLEKEETVMEYLRGSFDYLDELSKKLEKLYEDMGSLSGDELDKAIQKSSKMQDELNDSNYYDIESQIKKVANGLGVGAFGYETKVGTLSGGERAKLMLSKLILEEPDLMLLDEPTNFLDVEHIDWLIKYLNAYKKTFLCISHDTGFLNQISQFIVSIDNAVIHKFTGNYDHYLEQREMLVKQYEEDYKRQQAEIKKLEDYIAKNKVRAATAAMANARKKRLDKIEVMAPPTIERDCSFSFPYQSLNAKDMLIVSDLKVGYTTQLIPDISFHMGSQTKLWLRGTNGVGKTTTIKTLLRLIPSLGGDFKFHIEANLGYIEQELNFETARDLDTPFSIYSNMYPKLTQKEIRTDLSRVGLDHDLATRQYKKLSGGEMMRLKLAILCKKKTNMLILDEPTNHLDIKAKAALKKAISEYGGAVILVSHEADFAEGICDKVFDAYSK